MIDNVICVPIKPLVQQRTFINCDNITKQNKLHNIL